MHISNECGNCCAMTRSRRREFSDQIWSVLISWGEVDRSLVDNPICDDCYNEFREVLIDRAQELEMALVDPVAYHKMVQAEQEQAKKQAGSVATTKKAAAPLKKAEPAKTAEAKKKPAKKVAAKKTAKKATKQTKKKTRKVGKIAS